MRTSSNKSIDLNIDDIKDNLNDTLIEFFIYLD